MLIQSSEFYGELMYLVISDRGVRSNNRVALIVFRHVLGALGQDATSDRHAYKRK